MLTKTIAAVLGLAALAGAASAHTTLSDAQYLAAARCQALMSSSALGKVDTSAVDKVLSTEGAYRSTAIADRAAEVRDNTRMQASHAGPQGRAALISERDGSCATVAHASMASAN